MDSFIPAPGTKFRWRSAIIDVCNAAERYELAGTEGGTSADAIQQNLANIDQKLFADAFDPSSVASLTEDQWREWIQGMLRACEQGITEFRPEPSAVQKKRTKVLEQNRPEFAAAWAALRALDVCEVYVAFSGEGGSGHIHGIAPIFRNQLATPTDTKFADGVSKFRSIEVLMLSAAPVKLEDLVRKLSNDLLTFPGVPDWRNREGGNGMLVWRLHNSGKNELTLLVAQYVTDLNMTELTYDEYGVESQDQ